MPLTPSQFIRQQRDTQQLSMKQFAARSGLGLSHAYQLLRGERKSVSVETLDAIALGFGMTPAEMAAAMGKSETVMDPGQLAWNALYEQMDATTRSKVFPMVRAAANTSDEGTANSSGSRINHRRGRQQPPIKSHQGRLAGVLVAICSPFLRRLEPAQLAATG